MKNALSILGIIVVLSGGFASRAAAADSDPVEKPEDFELRPLVTRYAKTATHITATTQFKAFREVELQEAENFDGIGLDFDLVVPLAERFQLRIDLPFYTSGGARLINPYIQKGVTIPHKNISIWGFGGTLDFANVQGDWQIVREQDHGYNLSVGGGVGAPLRYLNTSITDRYNHVGRVALGGVKFDHKFSDFFTLLANAGVRYYWESDDLNPSEGGDVFAHADLSVAGVFNPFHHSVFPVLELVYAGDFGSYNSILVVPEIVWPINSHFELKGGVTVGLTSDGESFGARMQVVVRF